MFAPNSKIRLQNKEVRVLKDVSENLCVIPFIHLGTKPDGVARVCCMAPALEITHENQTLSFPRSTMGEVWNSSYLKNLRQRMLAGEKLKECSSCWTQESAGPHSKRLRENKKYLSANRHRLHEAEVNGGFISDPPLYFDLRLGNKCNLRCRTCNPLFSHSWLNELQTQKRNDFLPNTLAEVEGSMSRANEMSAWYKEEFFDQLEAILPSLQEVYVSGGEPLIIAELEDFLAICVRRDFAKNIELRLNSNVSVLKPGFLNTVSQFKKISFGASIDAFGAKNDWLRAPSRWKGIVENLAHLYGMAAKNPVWNLTVNITVSVYNFFYVDELIVWLKETFPDLGFTFDFVSRPRYMSLEFLPPSMAMEAVAKLERLQFLKLSQHEQMYVSQLKGYLLGKRALQAQELLHQFYNHTDVVDRWRSQTARTLFPELFRGLECTAPLEHEVGH